MKDDILYWILSWQCDKILKYTTRSVTDSYPSSKSHPYVMQFTRSLRGSGFVLRRSWSVSLSITSPLRSQVPCSSAACPCPVPGAANQHHRVQYMPVFAWISEIGSFFRVLRLTLRAFLTCALCLRPLTGRPSSVPSQFVWHLWWTKWHGACPSAHTWILPAISIPPMLLAHILFAYRWH